FTNSRASVLRGRSNANSSASHRLPLRSGSLRSPNRSGSPCDAPRTPSRPTISDICIYEKLLPILLPRVLPITLRAAPPSPLLPKEERENSIARPLLQICRSSGAVHWMNYKNVDLLTDLPRHVNYFIPPKTAKPRSKAISKLHALPKRPEQVRASLQFGRS